MTTLDEAALLRTIVERAFDDAPRLVYADWLDENGDPDRAEFIRVQCELAETADEHGDRFWDGQLSDGPESYRHRKALRRRQRELLDAHGVEWARPIAEAVGAKKWGYGGPTCGPTDRLAKVNWEFCRGFVESVTCTLADWYGAPCGRCDGDGRAHGADRPFEGPPGPCPVCKGSRRTPALGPRVVACQPVTGVTLTDRVPLMTAHGHYWAGYAPIPSLAHDLPPGVFAALAEPCRVEGTDGRLKFYPTRDDALAALSHACVSRARSEAGLGVLTPAVP